MSSSRWCFTLNNPTPAETELYNAFLSGDQVRYGVVGSEVGESGTPHLQGFFILHSPRRLAFVNGALPRSHKERARGTSEQAADYCKKDGIFQEWGSLPNSQGTRNDIAAFRQWVTEQEARPTQRQIANEFPSLFLRYPRLTELVEHLRERPVLVVGELREWQLDLEQFLETDPDDRSVNFYVNPEGNAGKSWFVRYMVSKKPDDVQFLSVGKRDDLAYAIDENKSIFLFDVPRFAMEHFQYAVLEKLKDQLIFSSKYASRVKVLAKAVHVVVFCNEQPNMAAMTGDRYVIKNI